jgi:ubiquitin-protein ligase
VVESGRERAARAPAPGASPPAARRAAPSAADLLLNLNYLHPNPTLTTLTTTPQVVINEDNLADVQAEYSGPAGTPYEAGLFRARLLLPPDFPAAPPRGFFLTKIFHPNVSTTSGQ